MSRKRRVDDTFIRDKINEEILCIARNSGCNENGDLVWFNKRCYYVNIREGTVTERLFTK